MVPSKGIDEKNWSVSVLTDDVKWLGHTRLILKSDNEKAIVRVLKDSLRALRVEGLEQVGEEHPPVYDPQANGNAEVGVKLLKGMFRTRRSCLEKG